MRVINKTRDNVLAENAAEARTFLARLRGWLGAAAPVAGSGLYLTPCAWVHTFGLRWALDVIYINSHGLVLAVRTLAPARLGPWVPAAAGVLELPAGTCQRLNCRAGDQLAGPAWGPAN
jgi:uncharacterized protein